MRRAAGLSAMHRRVAARDPDGAEFPLHAASRAQGPRHQRTLSQRAEDRRRIQGLAWARLRLLLDQAVAPCEEDQKRCKEFSDRAAVDDQPLTAISSVRFSRPRIARP